MLRTLVSTLLLASLPLAPRADDRFHFLHITDTHVTASSHQGPVRDLLAGLASRPGAPSFILHTGDVTELGTEDEFQAFRNATNGAPMPIHCVPGNHDVRWAPTGKEAFRRALGPTYHSFDQGRCHFVMLDSTVLLEHWGHFDSDQLRWLRADLKRLKPGTPVFLGFHHWFGMAGTNIDNGPELLEVLRPYNVVAMFIGHGHSLRQWTINGIPCFMTRGLYQGNYTDVEVGETEAIVRRVAVAPEPPGTAEVARLSLSPRPRLRADIEWDDPNLPLLERRRFSVRVQAPRSAASQPIEMAFSVNGAPPVPVKRPDNQESSAPWAAQFETAGLPDGWNTLTVTVTMGTENWSGVLPFAVERLEGHPKLLWRAATGDPIQSSAVVHNGTAYVSGLDRFLYAFDADRGTQKWKHETGGGIFGTPCATDAAVYVGSMDGFVYAIDATNGRLRWKADMGSPLFATPAVSGNVVCLGCNGRIVGLNKDSGQELWSVKTLSFFQSRAAEADGVFYLGGWDNAVRAIDAATGALRWTAQMGRSNGGRGGISFYYSPAIASPVVGDGRLYVCTNDGLLHALDTARGHELWTAKAPANCDTFGYSSPSFADGTVFVGGLGEAGRGNCYAIDASTGALRWKAVTGHDNYDSGCTVAGGQVVIGSVDGTLTWIDHVTGAISHSYRLPQGYCFSTAAVWRNSIIMPSMSSSVYAVQAP